MLRKYQLSGKMDGAEKARAEGLPKKPGGQNRIGKGTESVFFWPSKV